MEWNDDLRRLLSTLRQLGFRLWGSRVRWLVVNTLVGVTSVVYLLIFAAPYYQASVSIMPGYGSGGAMGNIRQLATLAGITETEGAPVEIYDHLLRSEAVLEPVVRQRYVVEGLPDSVDLIQYFEVETDESLPKDLAKRKALLDTYRVIREGVIQTEIDRLSRILTITITIGDPKLSADIANRIVSSLDEYVRTRRLSIASNKRQYIERRLAEVKDSLAAAERSLSDFRTQNRSMAQSPALLLEDTRRSRDVQVLQSAYLELSAQLEFARIEEVKDVPVVDIDEPAGNPVDKAGPRRMMALFILMTFSTMLTTVYYAFRPDIRASIQFLLDKGT